MEDNKRSRGMLIRWVIITIIFAAIVVCLLIRFTKSGMKSAKAHVSERMAAEVVTWGVQLDEEVTAVEKYTEIVLMYINTRGVMPESSISQGVLQSITKGTEVEKIYVLKDGKVISDEKGYGPGSIDLSAIEIGNVESTTCLIVSGPQYGMNDYLAVIVPVEFTRSLVYLINLESIKLEESAYKDTSFLAIIDKDGKNLGHFPQFNDNNSKFLEEKNIISAISQGTEAREDFNLSKVRMYNGIATSLYSTYKDDQRIISIEKAEKANFYLVYGVRQSSASYLIKETFKDIKGSVFTLCVVVILYSLVVTSTTIYNFIKNNERGKVLEDKADTDLLTELNNKAATERKIQEYMDSKSDGRGMMFILDIDNFKKINDTMGHAFGDTLLKTLGKELKVEFRVTDIIGRTGGDEFMVFLKDVKDDLIVEREANRIVRFFHDFKAGEDYVNYSASASIGAAIYPDDAKSFKDLYIAADQALYRAKKRGKNQLVFYNEDEHTNPIQ